MNSDDALLTEAGPEKKGGRPFVAGFVGLVLGLVAGLMAPSLLGPYMPAVVRGDEPVVGSVVAKSREADRLLLTVVAGQGATLVTMTKRIDEIDLLVEMGDSVALHMSGYRPFVTNPTVAGVYKPAKGQGGAARPATGLEEAPKLGEEAARGERRKLEKAPGDTVPEMPDTLRGRPR